MAPSSNLQAGYHAVLVPPPRPWKTWNLVVCFMQALSQTFWATLEGLSVCRHSKSTNDIDTTHSAINGSGQRSGYPYCRWAETRRARWWLSQLTTFSAEPGPSARRNTSPQKRRRSVPSRWLPAYDSRESHCDRPVQKIARMKTGTSFGVSLSTCLLCCLARRGGTRPTTGSSGSTRRIVREPFFFKAASLERNHLRVFRFPRLWSYDRRARRLRRAY